MANKMDLDPQENVLELEDTFAQVIECLKFKDPLGLKTLILERKFSDEVHFWDLMNELGNHITEENSENSPGFFDACERCMNYLINSGKPKELLLSLLEQADTFNDDVKYKTLLGLIQKALLKLPAKRQLSVELAMETLTAHLLTLELPQELLLEGEEKKLFDSDPKVVRICDLVFAYLDFLSPFIDEVAVDKREKTKMDEEFEKYLSALLRNLLKLLDRPLIYLDLSYLNTKEGKSDPRRCVEIVVKSLGKLKGNFHNLIESSLQHNSRLERKKRKLGRVRKDEESEEEAISIKSLACLSYLAHCEQVGADFYPTVFNTCYLLQYNLKFVLLLLGMTESQVVYKGVFLLKALVSNVAAESLRREELGNRNYFAVLECIFQVMIRCPDQDVRQACVPLVPAYIQCFNLEGRYQLFVQIFTTCTHSGVFGFVTQHLKDEINSVLTSGEGGEHFFGLKMMKLLKLLTALEDGPATDLLDNSDRIIAVLNFLRYLTIRDPPTRNATGFWEFMETADVFFENVRTGLEMSRGHYNLKLEQLKEGGSSKSAMLEPVEVSLEVGGQAVPKMARGQQIAIIGQALNTFDVINSVLSRVEELISQQKWAAKLQ